MKVPLLLEELLSPPLLSSPLFSRPADLPVNSDRFKLPLRSTVIPAVLLHDEGEDGGVKEV